MIHAAKSHGATTPGTALWHYQAPQSRWLNHELRCRNFWGQDYPATRIQTWDPTGSSETGSYSVNLGTNGFNLGWSDSTAGEISAHYRGGSTDRITHKLDELEGENEYENTCGITPGARARMDKGPLGCGAGVKRVFSLWVPCKFQNVLYDTHTLKLGAYFGWPC